MQNELIQDWHILMLNNYVRNVAFYKAIAANLKPGDLVLDIGTGTGILSMMAAKLGAAHVYTCEVNPNLYSKALEIIELNGYKSQITVFNQSSFDLKSIPTCDLLVTETIADDIFGENILKIVQDAQHRLLKPNAKIIPSQIKVYVTLIESRFFMEKLQVFSDNTCGFDLSPVNAYGRNSLFVTKHDLPHYKLLCNPTKVIEMNLLEPYPTQQQTLVDITATGTAHGFLVWGAYQLSEGNELETGPWSAQTSWNQMFYAFSNQVEGIPVKAKQLGLIKFNLSEKYTYFFELF